VLLPAEGWKNALAELNTLHEREQILDRDLVKIDMRLADRLVFRLQPDAAKARKEQVEERMKRSWHKT
jgi:cell division protein FtsQ